MIWIITTQIIASLVAVRYSILAQPTVFIKPAEGALDVDDSFGRTTKPLR